MKRTSGRIWAGLSLNASYSSLNGFLSSFLSHTTWGIKATCIRKLGDTLTGVNDYYTNILTVLSLAELGIGTAFKQQPCNLQRHRHCFCHRNNIGLDIIFLLSLAELGIGTAFNYSLYGPVARDDYEKIKSYMLLYKSHRNNIGLDIIFLLRIHQAILIRHKISADRIKQENKVIPC